MRQVTASLLLIIMTVGNSGTKRLAAQGLTRTGQKVDLLWRKLERDVAKIDEGLDGVLAVAIKDLTDGRTLFYHADEIMPTASAIKVAILAELYRQEAAGQQGKSGVVRLADPYTVDKADIVAGSDIMAGLTPGVTTLTNRDLATMMIAVSDNSATNVLIKRVGLGNVNTLLSGLGFTETKLRRQMMDLKAATEGRENTATPADFVTLLEALHRGQIVPAPLKDEYFKMLATHKDSDIPRLLPDDLTIANKPGSLEGVRSDVGIVFTKNRPFAIAVMTTFDRDERAAEQAISEVALLAYRYFERLGRASTYGRVISPKN